jgi:hypothetical protein
VASAARSIRHLCDDLVQAETRGLLPWRELLESRQELGNDRLRRHKQEDVPEQGSCQIFDVPVTRCSMNSIFQLS